MIHTMSDKLPDGGAQLRAHKQKILDRLNHLNRPVPAVNLTSERDVVAPKVSSSW